MKMLPLLALLVSAPTLLLAQEAAQPQPLPAACTAILAKPFDGGLDPRVEPDCDSTAYYFGIGRDKDFAAARACAFIERFKHVDKDGSMFTGAGVLSLVYANGEGTPRDLDMARRFVCENKEADYDEIDARLKVLDKIAATPVQPPTLSLCTTASSGISWGWCTNVQLRLDDAKRYNEMVAIVDQLSPAGVDAFKKLQTAEGAYEASRVAKEVDQTGLAQWAWSQQEEDRVRAQFVADLKAFANPEYTQPVTLATAQSVMDKAYANLQANAGFVFRGTTITFAGVQETQAAWLKYRDAWRAYEGVVHPALSSDAVATQITRERLTQLHKLSKE